MFEYHLQLQTADNHPYGTELIEAIKEAITSVNNSFSATRYNRKLHLLQETDDQTLQVLMTSDTPVPSPTRSLSSLSRALVQLEKGKSPSLLDGRIINGRIFQTALLSENKLAQAAISDVDLIRELTSIIFGQSAMNNRNKKLAREATEAVRDVVLDYLNKKTTE